MDDDATRAGSWPELVDRGQAARERRIAKVEQRAAARAGRSRTSSPWLRMLLAWSAVAVVAAVAAWGFQAWNDRELVIAPEVVAGLVLAPEGSGLQAEAQRINDLRPPQPGLDLSKTRTLAYGTWDQFVWATVFPTGRYVGRSTLDYLTADTVGYRWEAPTRVGETWCVRGTGGDETVVFCLGADDDASVIVHAGWGADLAQAARATDELLAAQTG